MVKVRIHELAAKEFNEAIEWYERQAKGLGEQFKESVSKKIKNIKQNPLWFLIEEGNIYKSYIPRFPYKILFTIEKEGVVVWAISHMHRKPWYWQSRKARLSKDVE